MSRVASIHAALCSIYYISPDHGSTQDSNFDDVFNIDEFVERNEYGNEVGMGGIPDGFRASAFESNNTGSTTPSALGGDFTLVSSAVDDKQPDGGIAASVHDSPKDDDNESKLEPSLLDQNSPLSELSPLPSHNNSIDMDQENENDDPDGGIPSSSKAKAKSRDTSPLSPASSRQPPSPTSKTHSLTASGSKTGYANAIAGPSSMPAGIPPPLSAASSSSAATSPTNKRAEVDRKILTVLEVNAELFECVFLILLLIKADHRMQYMHGILHERNSQGSRDRTVGLLLQYCLAVY